MSKSALSIEVISKFESNNQHEDLSLAVLEGLVNRPKSLPSRLFYDDKGSQLFQRIMELEEYYPTRCETEIFKNHGSGIAKQIAGEDLNLVELGCGDGVKTILLLNNLLEESKKINYVPLDISKGAIESLYENLENEYGDLPFSVSGLVAEYFQGLSWLTENAKGRNLVLFLGSNIGNFNKPTAMRFLRQLWYSLNPGDYVLIGFDLKKDLDVLYNAYNDSKGVTKEFNFNVLDRINSLLGANFDRRNFQHQGLYNVQTGAMESYLISQCKHEVLIDSVGKSFKFQPWEAIHMEYSYKYLDLDVSNLAKDAGYEIKGNFYDNNKFFMDSLWEVKK